MKAYRARFGETPDALSALGYDAARILADAIERARSVDGRKVRDAMATAHAFEGVSGMISIDRERNAIKPVLILQIEDGRYVLRKKFEPEHMGAK